MRTITTTLYRFSELSEDAKQRAINEFRERNGNLDYEWWDFVYEDSANIADIIGIDLRNRKVKLMDGSTRYDPDIYFSGFYHQGSGSSFRGSYRYKKGCKKEIRSYAPLDVELHRIVDGLQEIQSRHFYGITAQVDPGRNDNTIRVSVDYNSHNYQYLQDGADQEIEDLMNAFNSWIYSRLKTEYEYLQSDECIAESLEANEYEFTEEGSIS